ncbi:hypothetical protein VLL38_002812 [Klebsiella pneumoniae]|nr:hypothetical protein [Klebsiella pneumoniae]
MLPEFLKYGYLGLLAIIIVLSYRIIINGNNKNHKTSRVIYILLAFSLINFLSGFMGYIWASKELEVAAKKATTASILDTHIRNITKKHEDDMLPLQLALKSTVDNLKVSLLESTRSQYLNEIERINKVIREREIIFSENINNLKNNISKEVD